MPGGHSSITGACLVMGIAAIIGGMFGGGIAAINKGSTKEVMGGIGVGASVLAVVTFMCTETKSNKN